MTRVAFFTEILTEDFDGAARTMFQIINRIDSSMYDYLFVYGDDMEQFRSFKSFKVPRLNIPINKDYNLSIPQMVYYKLEKVLDDFDPEVIHIATPSILGFYAMNYAKKRNIPILSIYHTHFISYIPFYLQKLKFLIAPTEYWIKKTMEKFYNSCDKIYVPSQAMLDALQNFGVESSRMSLWQRGIDRELFNPLKRNPAFVQRITKNNKPNILFASRIVWEKNIETLIKIYAELCASDIDFNFIVIGDGKAREQAEEQMPGAFFLGKKNHDELAKFYASCDVFVFPSTSETYGNVVVEAMASGIPCVISDQGGSASLVKDNHTGFVCKAYSSRDYVGYILELLNDSSLRNRITEAALAGIAHLGWDKLTQNYFQDIDELSQSAWQDSKSQLGWAN